MGDLLVVFGHLVTGPDPIGNSWYVTLKVLVYEFHMPFFMFLSGAVFQVTFRASGELRATLKFITSRVQRLLPAFVLFSAIIWAGKHAASRFLTCRQFRPRASPNSSRSTSPRARVLPGRCGTIYVPLELYVLFAIVATTAAGCFLHSCWRCLCGPCISLHTCPRHWLCEYAIFFVIGMALARSFDVVMPWLKDQCAAVWHFRLFFPFDAARPIHGPRPSPSLLPAVLVFASSFTSAPDQRKAGVYWVSTSSRFD
ncbi:MAG: acyltransferase family protein [Steroidobacteraceae bacterium]